MIIIVRLALNLGSSCNFQVSIGFMDNIIEEVTGSEYKYGFVTNVETDTIGKGLNEEVIRIISAKKEEPDWMLEFRLKAYRHWLTMKMPRWAQLSGYRILCSSETEGDEELGRGRSGIEGYFR